jgi:hypothetical protein
MKYSNDRTNPADERFYRVTIRESVGDDMMDWFGGMDVIMKENATIIEGRLVDQSELQGLLRKIHDLRLTLISVETITENQNMKEGQ